MVVFQNYAKISFKELCKNFSYLFFHKFLRNMFSNRPSPNFIIILICFYIYWNYWKFIWVLDTFRALLRVLLAVNLSDCLDFFNKSPCLDAKIRIPFRTQFFPHNYLRYSNSNTISPSINNLKCSSLISSLLSLPFFPSFLFLMLRSYEQKINIWHYIKSN